MRRNLARHLDGDDVDRKRHRCRSTSMRWHWSGSTPTAGGRRVSQVTGCRSSALPHQFSAACRGQRRCSARSTSGRPRPPGGRPRRGGFLSVVACSCRRRPAGVGVATCGSHNGDQRRRHRVGGHPRARAPGRGSAVPRVVVVAPSTSWAAPGPPRRPAARRAASRCGGSRSPAPELEAWALDGPPALCVVGGGWSPSVAPPAHRVGDQRRTEHRPVDPCTRGRSAVLAGQNFGISGLAVSSVSDTWRWDTARRADPEVLPG